MSYLSAKHLRQTEAIRTTLSACDRSPFCLDYKFWSWKQLKALRSFIGGIADTREARAGGHGKIGASLLQARLDALWSHFEPR